MSNVTVLPVLGDKRSIKNATRWLERSQYDALLVSMPEELENFVRSYVRGDISEDELWNSYRILTGAPDPLVNSIRSKFKPLTEYLRNETERDVDVYCYDDLTSHVKSGQYAERILLLSYRGRVCRDLDLDTWRRLLLEELRTMRSAWKRSVENLVEKVVANFENMVFYEGLIGPLVKQLRRFELSVKVARAPTYWRSPLDALRVAAWLKGESYLTDENIRTAVEQHMKYLETVILSRDMDESDEKWSDTISFQRRRRENTRRGAE
jgi:hypothetical protein